MQQVKVQSFQMKRSLVCLSWPPCSASTTPSTPSSQPLQRNLSSLCDSYTDLCCSVDDVDELQHHDTRACALDTTPMTPHPRCHRA